MYVEIYCIYIVSNEVFHVFICLISDIKQTQADGGMLVYIIVPSIWQHLEFPTAGPDGKASHQHTLTEVLEKHEAQTPAQVFIQESCKLFGFKLNISHLKINMFL